MALATDFLERTENTEFTCLRGSVVVMGYLRGTVHGNLGQNSLSCSRTLVLLLYGLDTFALYSILTSVRTTKPENSRGAEVLFSFYTLTGT